MNPISNLKKQNFIVLLPALILSLVAFVLAIIAVFLYANNCGSEFNGNKPSANVTGLGIAAIVAAGLALLIDIAGLFLARSRKVAFGLALSRIGNYAAFAFLLGAFLFQILDEYSLLGTILYPIFSGAVGDPVDGTLTASYFSSLIMLLVACIISVVSGVMIRKASHKILPLNGNEEREVPSHE